MELMKEVNVLSTRTACFLCDVCVCVSFRFRQTISCVCFNNLKMGFLKLKLKL